MSDRLAADRSIIGMFLQKIGAKSKQFAIKNKISNSKMTIAAESGETAEMGQSQESVESEGDESADDELLQVCGDRRDNKYIILSNFYLIRSYPI